MRICWASSWLAAAGGQPLLVEHRKYGPALAHQARIGQAVKDPNAIRRNGCWGRQAL
jgi:hypothetical protein